VTDPDRRIDLEIEVAGTPEEVWEAIATGPGTVVNIAAGKFLDHA
jgi:hypothetical protein